MARRMRKFVAPKEWDKPFGVNSVSWVKDKVAVFSELARRISSDGVGPTFRRFRQMRELKKGNLVGVDEYGNAYYEDPGGAIAMGIPPKRWIEYAAGHGDRDAMDIPPEWHAWLHHCGSTPLYGGGAVMGYQSYQVPFYRQTQHGNLSADAERVYRPAAHLFKGSQETDHGVKRLVSDGIQDAVTEEGSDVETRQGRSSTSPQGLLEAFEQAQFEALPPKVQAMREKRASQTA